MDEFADNYPGIMRTAKSYSIVDHQLLHGGYFYRLSHSSLALYLFLVVVGDKDGKSFYGEKSLSSILRLNAEELAMSIDELMDAKLIYYNRPYFWVNTLEGSANGRITHRANQISSGQPEAVLPSNRGESWVEAKDCLKGVLRQLARDS
jgi:hypothetical protein